MSRTFFFIYKTTNKVNGKFYVGKHKTKRLQDNYIGSGKILKRAIHKYGRDNFSFQILEMFETEAEMNAAEAAIVTEEFCLNHMTYNLCRGGNGGFSYINRVGLKPSNKGVSDPNNVDKYRGIGRQKQTEIYAQNPEYYKEVIAKRVVSWKESRKEIGGTFKGRNHSDETKARMSQSSKGTQTGKNNSQHGSYWITNGVDNKKHKGECIPDGWFRGRILNNSK